MGQEDTVGDLVAALVETYSAGTAKYAAWRRRTWERGDYHYHYDKGKRPAAVNDDGKNGGSSSQSTAEIAITTSAERDRDGPKRGRVEGFCAASISLRTSETRIRDAFDNGVDTLGDSFKVGDETCCNILRDNLELLRECIGALETATLAETGSLPLANVVQVSESVREASLTALHKHYQKVAIGRLMPRHQPSGTTRPGQEDEEIIQPESETTTEGGPESAEEGEEEEEEEEQEQEDNETPKKHGSPGSHHTSQPPSPPPTPSRSLSTSETTDARRMTIATDGGISTTSSAHLTNSVFRVFCPGALKYQVYLQKPLPRPGETGGEQPKCKCGYAWYRYGAGNGGNSSSDMKAGENEERDRVDDAASAAQRASFLLKNGFRLTPRFLGKSHCAKGFGCVLCTSTGSTETFESLDALRTHINSNHTKWQLLHDPDLLGRT
ncbi:hypothetical protein F5Y16DRAFT_379932 [Xylariaceae sp. FL0255]|nr:hypothetical protein F5Y16DRAFT_379932 [Xylariaceae sp. FL0255]